MTQSKQVWIIDDDKSIRWVLERTLASGNISYQSFSSAEGVLEQLSFYPPRVIISDIRMPGRDGITLMEQVKVRHPEIPVIIITAHSDLESTVSSYQSGAFEYLPKPFDMDDALELVKRALQHRDQFKATPTAEPIAPSPEIIGEAPAMQDVFKAIGRLSQSNITVLINGQSGTGKELVASALHRHSPRKDKPFIALNMAAIPGELIESELFGHDKGAFTGANTQRPGRFEQANGGTLFLDEIGDMPIAAQTRLLRVLSNGEFYRVGGHMPVNVDVRIIAATHQDLQSLVRNGRFREDLFHRLNVIRIQLPALKERPEDIESLSKHFLAMAAKEMGEKPKKLQPEVIHYFEKLPWPGNVRQLENTCRWLTAMASSQDVQLTDLPDDLTQTSEAAPTQTESWEEQFRTWVSRKLKTGEVNILSEAVPAFEKILIECALKYTGGKKRDAAQLLGWGRNTLTRKLKELSLDEL